MPRYHGYQHMPPAPWSMTMRSTAASHAFNLAPYAFPPRSSSASASSTTQSASTKENESEPAEKSFSVDDSITLRAAIIHRELQTVPAPRLVYTRGTGLVHSLDMTTCEPLQWSVFAPSLQQLYGSDSNTWSTKQVTMVWPHSTHATVLQRLAGNSS